MSDDIITDQFQKDHEAIPSKKDDFDLVAEGPSSSIYLNQYNEEIVTPLQYAQNVVSNPRTKVKNYLISLFPIARWILHYNEQWLYGDIIAGITVGVVIVPQSMGYAALAGLTPEFGLYSSFVGVFIYCFFATSKDVSIGPVAVMSTQVGRVVIKVQEKYPDASLPVIGTFLSLICGSVALGLGILRLGFILEFIPNPAVFAFMTGSALNIVAGQVPLLMGYNKSVNTRDATYLVIINTLKHLPDTKVDLAFGLVCLFILYVWKFGCDYGMKRYPRLNKVFFYVQVIRHAFVIIIATVISWAITHPYQKKHPGEKVFSIIGKVPSGLKHTGVMTIPSHEIIVAIASEIPVSTIILLLEHISISKSFGRLNDYKVIPDQELIAIGVTNLIGTFFNAYPATGSFSRSALKAKSGVRTPLAGILTGAVVLLALYCLTKAFYYIPKLALSLIIIHCVSDLVASYKVSWNLWKTSPLDFGIFIIGVIITVFATIEDGIYFTVCASVAVILWRLSKPNGVFLGKVSIAEVVNPKINRSGDQDSETEFIDVTNNESKKTAISEDNDTSGYSTDDRNTGKQVDFHTRWVPLPSKSSTLHTSLVNSDISIVPPPPGVLVFRPSESFTYPNSSRQIDVILDEVKTQTKAHESKLYKTTGDRPWNNPPPLEFDKLPVVVGFNKLFKRKSHNGPYQDSDGSIDEQEIDPRPYIRIIHFDLSTCTGMDATSIQALRDLHKLIFRYSGVDVEFHFSGIISPWIRRSLLAVGFGKPHYFDSDYRDLEEEISGSKVYTDVGLAGENRGLVSALDTDTPFFHLDIPSYS